MTQLTIEMPIVAECAATECAFNVNRNCHAKAITVGKGIHPGCDTYFGAREHTHDAGRTAGVGACKVTQCRYNEDFECAAEKIKVGPTAQGAVCLTYAPEK